MVEVKAIGDKQVWENYVTDFVGANFLQSWNWGEFHQALGHQINRMGFYKGGKLAGVMLTIVESGRRAKYLTVPAGPLIDWQDGTMRQAFVKEIRRQAQELDCSFVRVRPQVLDIPEYQNLFSELGFKVAPMHLHAQLTLKLHLIKNDEELMAQMRKATRYELKQAMKMGIVVEKSTSADDLDAFYDLQTQTAHRQAFVPFSRKYLKEQFRAFAEDNQVILFTAKLQNQVLAQAMVIFYGQEADYHYGASSSEGRRYPGAYLLMWEALQEAKRRRLKYYDLWGVAPDNNPNHRFAGVSLFKRGFGGQVVEYLPARDLVISWPRYAVNWLVEEIRRRVRGL